MTTCEKLTLAGQSHWSARGRLEYELWYWWVEVAGVKMSDEEMRPLMITKERGLAFIQEIRPFLPPDIETYIEPPNSVPGGCCNFKFPLSRCSDLRETEKIVEKYFPELYALAA